MLMPYSRAEQTRNAHQVSHPSMSEQMKVFKKYGDMHVGLLIASSSDVVEHTYLIRASDGQPWFFR